MVVGLSLAKPYFANIGRVRLLTKKIYLAAIVRKDKFGKVLKSGQAGYLHYKIHVILKEPWRLKDLWYTAKMGIKAHCTRVQIFFSANKLPISHLK